MSTSFDGWPEQARGGRVQSFTYPVAPAIRGRENELCSEEAARAARELAMKQEMAEAVAAARAEGLRQGEAQARTAAAEAVEQERSAVSQAVQEFAQQRAGYFREVESEVVRLALAIARKVLHREAQLDPLLLAGVVRVALDQMQAGTRVVLRTAADSADQWRQFCEQHGQGHASVEVIADPALEPHRCVLQAEVGSTEISLDNQLQEIEQGFFDLLRKRPEPKHE